MHQFWDQDNHYSASALVWERNPILVPSTIATSGFQQQNSQMSNLPKETQATSTYQPYLKLYLPFQQTKHTKPSKSQTTHTVNKNAPPPLYCNLASQGRRYTCPGQNPIVHITPYNPIHQIAKSPTSDDFNWQSQASSHRQTCFPSPLLSIYQL